MGGVSSTSREPRPLHHVRSDGGGTRLPLPLRGTVGSHALRTHLLRTWGEGTKVNSQEHTIVNLWPLWQYLLKWSNTLLS